MPLNNKKKFSRGKAAQNASGYNRLGEAGRNVLGAGKKAKADLKKKAIKATVRDSADENLAISRGLGPGDASSFRKSAAANKLAGKAGVPTQRGRGEWVATGGSSASKTVNKRIKQSMDARPELKGKYKP